MSTQVGPAPRMTYSSPWGGGGSRHGKPSDVQSPSDNSLHRVSELLREAAETHHVVYRIVDGDDPDWASWYADWLITLSELPAELGGAPVRSALVHALVELDRGYTAAEPGERWEDFYARGLVERFASG